MPSLFQISGRWSLLLPLHSSKIMKNYRVELLAKELSIFRLPPSDDADWNEKSSLRTNARALRTRVCLQQKQNAQRSGFVIIHSPLGEPSTVSNTHPGQSTIRELRVRTWAFPLFFQASQVFNWIVVM